MEVEVEMDVVEEAGVVRAELEELAERVDGVEAEEDCDLGDDAWRRDMLGSLGRGTGCARSCGSVARGRFVP